jgi:hypothetical protein
VNLKLIGIALLASSGLAQLQTEETSTPKFEVTSVKPNKSPDLSKGLLQFLPSGRFVATNLPLIQVIAVAWNLPLQSQRLTLASGLRMQMIFTMSFTILKQPRRKARFHRD